METIRGGLCTCRKCFLNTKESMFQALPVMLMVSFYACEGKKCDHEKDMNSGGGGWLCCGMPGLGREEED